MSGKLETLKKNIQESLSNAELLMSEVDPLINSIRPELTDPNVMNSVNVICDKIKNLHVKMSQIRNEIGSTEQFVAKMREVIESDKFLDNLETFSRL